MKSTIQIIKQFGVGAVLGIIKETTDNINKKFQEQNL